ncbi:hypothetical protein D0C36_22770 [Mucilaginibacter conchicola]|uniref:Uncharacterized protein n=1 Tax=Mucilaginibacter conchicola TaxID=2303333 RepID=A0A372NMI6_9SPHI|nr:hypothetical protein [Mucilaginibacter conchicola]RFZ90068.1 hypothetical protein D0C36_22770 [Mucilaginibacter conchicola]
MYDITLISTVHTERGNCTSAELYKIISGIAPEIIFEELPDNLFKICYDQEIPMEVLELKCVHNYLKDYPVKHFPVDIDISATLSNYHIDYMFNEFNRYDAYRKIERQQVTLTEEQGFGFLNSSYCAELFAEKAALEKQLIAFSNQKEFLADFYDRFHKEQESREIRMIENIYNISFHNEYHQAVFLLGSGHRRSFEKLAFKFNEMNDLKLNWKFYKEHQ